MSARIVPLRPRRPRGRAVGLDLDEDQAALEVVAAMQQFLAAEARLKRALDRHDRARQAARRRLA